MSADAPSGVYYMGFYRPYSNGYWSVYSAGTSSSTTKPSTVSTSYHSLTGWINWSYYYNYAVMVCRKGVSKPQAEYGEGVSSDLKSKTVNYTGEPQTFTLKGDWGPGMTTVVMEEWDKATSSWVPATNLTIGSRSAAGAGVQGNTDFTATNAGKYRITYTPFRNWTDGSRDPIVYNFEIKSMKLSPTKIVQEEGVDQAANKKFLYATRKDLYISLYPIPSQWADYTTGGLSVFNYSANGVLTLSERNQGVYTITVTLKDPNNVSWDDGTDNGSTDPLEFTFEIGPEKVTVPDIIQDTGQIGAFKKEVTFNGAYQTMSFMPINPYQLNITVQNTTEGHYLTEGIDYTVTDNTLTVRALDAGRYEIKISVKPEYIFEELSKELIYELIIYEAEIDAPILDETTAVNNVKTVTYGGEKVTVGDDGTTQDWVATLAFRNADEARIKWIPTSSNELGQQTWGDSRLVLSARSANTYTVRFEPQKNYKWKPGVNPPEYTLVIEKLKVAVPKLVNDGENGATFNSTTKQIGFDGNEHPFTLEFPTLAETKDTPYTKKSSVFIIHTGTFTENWDDTGDFVTFVGKEASTYTFTITPTNNYCWSDGSSSDKIFTFKIVPVNVNALHMYATSPLGGGLDRVMYANDTGYQQRLNFDGTEKTVRIGNVSPVDDSERYVTSGDFEKYFFLLDEDGNMINRESEGFTGIEAKLLDNMTANEEGGFLTITAIDAGTYRIGVYIRNTNFWWTETSATLIVYTLVIESQGIPQPVINESGCEGRDIIGHFEKDTVNGVYRMSGVYFDVNFKLMASLDDSKFAGYVEITDPDGNVYVHDPNKHDSEITAEMNEALSNKGGVYTDLRNGYLSFFAKDQGEYSWKIKITNSNYKWAGTNSLELTFTIVIARSPVSGVELHFVGDDDEAAINGANGILVGHDNVRGSDPDATTIIYDKTTFSDKEKEIFIKRTNIANLVKTGFSTQFEYSIKNIASTDGYDTSLMRPLDEHGVFNEDELRLFAYDAGTYEITITPTDNYCWNDNGKTTGSVMFTIVINKRVLDKPVIINDDGTHADPSVGNKETEFNRKYQTFALFMEKYPQGYKVGDFVYYDKEDRIGNDFAPVKISGAVDTDTGSLNLGVDVDTKAMSVQAKSAGEYTLFVVVSNENNYEFADGKDDLQYRYLIKKLKVELPEAYLSGQNLTAEEAGKKVLTENEVSTKTVGEAHRFTAQELYTVSTEYNGKYHTVYFYGTDVKGGDFNFTVSTSTTNGVNLVQTINPTDVLVDNTVDNTQEAGYFMLAATSVNAYTVKLQFTTKDFYWSTETADAKSEPREFQFIIRKNQIPVPRIEGTDSNLPLENDSYTIEYDYQLDLAGDQNTDNGAIPFLAELKGVLLGMDINGTSTSTTEYLFSNIKVKISSLTTTNALILPRPSVDATGKGDITFVTSTNGTDIDGGIVPNTYCIELEINPDNSEWDKGSKSANKKYFIKVNKMKVGVKNGTKYENPKLSVHDINNVLERHVTYTGEVFNSALVLTLYDSKFMKYQASTNLIPSGATDPDVTVTDTDAPPVDRYGKTVTVNAPAGADTYTLNVQVADSDNMEWGANGNSDDIVFKFVIDPIKVAKPYIHGANGDTSVVGLTKTVTFELNPDDTHKEQGLKIGNYWYNTTDTLTLGNTPATNPLPTIPDVMHYSVANGTLVTGYPYYTFDDFTIGDKYGAMEYNAFNNGLLEIMATEAGKYVIRFKLTDNAVWMDGSSNDIDITLIIKKQEVKDLTIDGVDSGTEKTVRYKLVGGTPVTHLLTLNGFDADLMGYDGLTAGNGSIDGGADGNIVEVAVTGSGSVYAFTAVNSGTYEVSFKLTDGANYRWEYADTDMAYFKLIVEKLVMKDPVIDGEFKLVNETVDDGLRTLTVDYDLREHTILVKSLFEEQGDGVYSGVGNKYFTVEDTTSTDYPSYNSSVHVSALNSYDSTSALKVEDLFEILGTGYNYDGEHLGESTSFINLFALTAYKPGEYYMTFKLTDTDNMVWYNSGTPTANDVKFKVIINKVKHAAPTVAAGDPTSKEYTGKDVTFKIVNAFNGFVNSTDTVATNTVSEKYEVTGYVGGNADVLANLNTPKYFEESWFNGILTLKFTHIGVYTVRVSITDTDNISWDNTNDTYRDFTFTVTERTLTADVKFGSDDLELNAILQAGATSWPLSAQVYAQITIKGLRELPAPATGVDSVLGFKIFYENSSAIGTEIEPLLLDETTGGWFAIKQTDGTYNLVITYNKIRSGKGNIAKGTYKLHIVQDTAHISNYILPDPNTVFTVDADPAPFKTDMLEWYFTRSDAPGIKIPIKGIGGDANNRFNTLSYELQSDGTPVTYTFHVRLNEKGMQGFENLGPAYTDIIDALNSWKVDWNGSYGGTRTVSNAGNNTVSVTITALDPNEYSFPNYTFTLYYTIQKAKYDLSDLSWDYDGSLAFEFDGTSKSVSILGLSGTMYAGLTVDRYITDGSFISYGVPPHVSTAVPAVTSNSMTYAGKYSTTVVFKVPANSNYELPVIGNPDTYTGTFSWTREWEITRTGIEVSWVTSSSSSSDGAVVTKTSPVIDGVHAGKFDYDYELWDDVTNPTNPQWVPVTSIKRKPGETLRYRATARLKSAPGTPASDYARSYTFKVLGENPLEFDVGGNDLEIINHIEIEGERLTRYEYTGNPFNATNVIDFDITNGLLGTPDMSISILYYAASAPTVPLSGAPTEVGSYIVKLKLSYTNTNEDYTLSEDEYAFEIIKAKFKSEDFEWHVTHDDGETSFEAKWEDGKWINVATKEEVKISYDGHAYEVKLVTGHADTVISFIFTENNKIGADSYEATATATIDTAHYEFNPSDPIDMTFEWTIEKHFLDLSKISWDYTEPFEFTLVNGTPKAFKAILKDLPDYLLDKIEYSVTCGADPVTGDVTFAGEYVTAASIKTDAIDADNYELGSWPAAIPTSLTWEIKRKEIEVPQNDLSWSEFDGVQHNLLKPFKLDVDYAEYFDVDVVYTDFKGDSVNYDGTSKYGGKYYAYDAGIYMFTFKINKDFNTDDAKNIVWLVNDGSIFRTDNDQNVSYTVGRKSLKVTGWNDNYESSTVILANGIDPTKFLEYKFYEGSLGSLGTEVDLDTILESGGGDTFSMVPVVKEAYQGNITLAFEAGTDFTTFVTQSIDEQDAVKVNDKPYIYGYMVDGVFKRFSNDELASGETFVIYTGQTVEFKIFNWDSYYSQYLTVWNGSLDDLIQSEAGEYSITLILRKDLEYPLYWGVDADNKIDRSSVTLKFEIRYRTLTIPEIPEEIVYDGTEINILDKATNATLAQLMAQYGDYVTIVGNKATNVGEQMLYLAIKDEYGNAIRWDNGTEQGLLGTYSILWKITPILLVRPEFDSDKTLEYDGKEHSVYEFIKGYDVDDVPQSIKDLMKHVNETNGRSINAGSFNAVLSLPGDNYAWCDASGNLLTDRSSVEYTWTINQKLIDFNNAYWGYMDGDNPVAYDSTKPFVYTISNGAAQPFTIEMLGMPEILKLYAKYTTNGVAGNSASAVDVYVTRVEFDLSKLDMRNYTIGNQLSPELSEIEWEIVPREFELPVYDDSWKVYDGEVHDLISMLGLGDDWADYFNVSVQYKVNEGDSWEDYDGDNDLVVGFSNYKAYNFGFYKIIVTLKASDPVWIPGTNVLWKDGVAPDAFVIEVAMRDVIVTGWFEDNAYSHVIFKDGETLPDGISEKFEYVIYEDGDLNKTPVSPEDVVGGKTYYMEFAIKKGSNAVGVLYSYGINLTFAEGVVNPYEFGSYNFAGQNIIWMPNPVLETATLEYNGAKQTFAIKDFNTLYKLTDEQRILLNSNYNLGLDASVKSYAYLQDVSSLTVTAAGEYTAVVRLLSKVYLSWYDPELYESSEDGRTLYHKGTTTPVSNPNDLYNNKSFVLNFKVTPKRVPLLSDEDLEKLAGILVSYDGTEKDVTVEAKAVFDELEAKYGKIFDYAGNKGTAADVYELIITLADNDSCTFYKPDTLEIVEKSVTVEGYTLKYVQDGDSWKVVFVKVDADGNAVKDSSGNYVEYIDKDGDYTIDVKYLPEFETSYVAIGSGENSLLNDDGTLNIEKNYFFHNGDHVVIDGENVVYEYKTDSSGAIVRFSETAAGSGVFIIDPAGTHILRTELSVTTGLKEYGYKIPIMEDKTEYTYLFSGLTIDTDGKPIPARDADGNPITKYLFWTGSDYELRQYVLDVDGKLEIDSLLNPVSTVIEANCQMVNSDRYSLVNGKFVADASGAYMNRYVLKADGSREQQIKYAKDANGNYVIDQKNSALKVEVYETATDVEYKVEWRIDSSVLAMPEFDEALMQQYTGGKLYAKDVLKGFLPDLMEIVEGGEGVNAGEYTAKIVITSPNSKWDPEITTENYVLVTWRIDTAKVDLSNIKWEFNDGTNTYEDSSSFVYTRKDGKPVVYWVDIANLPEVLRSKVVFKTNNKTGAYAGVSAGKYVTTVKFDTDENFEDIVIPETFSDRVEWSIGRRMLTIPDVSVSLVFDSMPHDLLELLGVPEDWNEYYDIDIKYSDGGEYLPFEGTDGNPYIAYNSGDYMFTFTIKSDINTSATNPNVVWLKKTEVTPPDEGADEPETPPAPENPAPEAPVTSSYKTITAEEEVEVEVVEEVIAETPCEKQEVSEKKAEKPEVTAIQQVCDRLEKLVCGAEVQIKSFRKYNLRGTL